MIYNVKIPCIALVRADSEAEAIQRFARLLDLRATHTVYNDTRINWHVEVIDANAFESEPLADESGVL